MNCYQRIKDLREDEDLTQEQAAIKLGVYTTQYCRYENSKGNKFFDAMIAIAQMYGVSLDYIAGLTNDKGGLHKNSQEESYILSLYNSLSEKRKGKAECLLEQLVKQQNKENQTTIKGDGNISIGDIDQSNSTNANISIGNKK